MGWAPGALEEIRRRCDLVTLVSQVVELRPRGRHLVGLCPFHPERTPSFYVTPERQLFRCFGCNAAGDVFSFVMRREGLSFAEAVEALARRVGVELRPATAAERRRRALRDRYIEALTAAAEEYRRALLHGEEGTRAREYLRRRGVDEETAERFGLGYAPPAGDWLCRRLSRLGWEGEVLERAGLAFPGRDGLRDRFVDRLMFPIRDEAGHVVGFGGRVLGEGQPKYLNSPETVVFSKRRVWFGLDLARPALRGGGAAIVMEGYMDVIAAHQAGFTTAVASLGTALSADQAQLLRRYAEEVVVAYDADAAGAQATWRSLDILQRAGLRVRVARIPAGKDPDEFLRASGAEAFGEVLAGAPSLVHYAFEVAAAGEEPAAPEAKARVAAAVAPFVLGVEDPVAQAAYVRDLADRLGVSEEAFRRLLLRQARSADGGTARREVAAALAPVAERGSEHSKRKGWHTKTDFFLASDGPSLSRAGLAEAERRLAAFVLVDPDWRRARAERLAAVPFADAACGRIVAAALACPEAGGVEVLDCLAGDTEARDLAALLLSGEEVVDARSADGCLERLEREALARRLASLEERLREASATGAGLPAQVVAEWQDLQRRLRGRAGRQRR